jgi:hypothetical protein
MEGHETIEMRNLEIGSDVHKGGVRDAMKRSGQGSHKRLDFSARKILDFYEKGIFKTDQRFLMIGFSTDPICPGHMAYDLDHPVRDDARVTMYMNGKSLLEDLSHETLREMHTYDALDVAKISTQPQRVSAVLCARQEISVAECLASPKIRGLVSAHATKLRYAEF